MQREDNEEVGESAQSDGAAGAEPRRSRIVTERQRAARDELVRIITERLVREAFEATAADAAPDAGASPSFPP